MSASVRLAAKLEGNELNGLDHIAHDLCQEPEQVILALVWLDVSKITTDVDSGAELPTVRVRRVEPVGALAEVPKAVKDLAEKLFEKRTGRVALPLEDIEGGEE